MGRYSVRSGYTIARLYDGSRLSLSSVDWSSRWKRLWSAKIPAEVKHFMWRMFHNFLPTGTILRGRQVDISTIYPVCRECDESMEHIIFYCGWARKVWKELSRLGISWSSKNSTTGCGLMSLWSYLYLILAWHVWGLGPSGVIVTRLSSVKFSLRVLLSLVNGLWIIWEHSLARWVIKWMEVWGLLFWALFVDASCKEGVEVVKFWYRPLGWFCDG